MPEIKAQEIKKGMILVLPKGEFEVAHVSKNKVMKQIVVKIANRTPLVVFKYDQLVSALPEKNDSWLLPWQLKIKVPEKSHKKSKSKTDSLGKWVYNKNPKAMQNEVYLSGFKKKNKKKRKKSKSHF